MTKSRIKPVAKGNPRRGGGIGARSFTNAEAIKNNFLAHTSIRQAQKISNDGGYWTGGQCDWGGEHYLLRDCQALADFANSVANINNDIQEITLAVNEQEFNNRKQQLASKLQGCISKCQVTSATSIGGICCIWNDFFGSFLKNWLNGFKQQLQSQLSQLQNIQPTHQKEILQLETEIKTAEVKYNDAMTKATTETDPAKKAQFIAIAQAAEREVKQAKQKLARNPLSKLAEYNHLHNLGNLIKGNLPSSPTNPINCPGSNNSSGSNSGGSSSRVSSNGSGGSGQTSWAGGVGNNNDQQSNHQQLIILAAVAILVIFFLMNQQKDET